MLVKRSLGAVLGLFLAISAAPQDASAQKVARAKVSVKKAAAKKAAKKAAKSTTKKAAFKSTAKKTSMKAPLARGKQAQKTNSSTRDPLKSSAHLSKVRAQKAMMTRHVYEGEPGAGGQVHLNAAFAVLMPGPGISQRQTRSLEYGNGKNVSQRVEVTGVKDGKWSGTLIGTVSVHDMASVPWSSYKGTVDKRIQADRIQISYDHGPGTKATILAKGVKSEAATAVDLKNVPLKKGGTTRIIYNRTDAGGRVVGAADAYAGRIVEIGWKGN